VCEGALDVTDGAKTMKIIDVSSRARTLAALLRQAQEENLILRKEDGREFVLAEVDDFDREIALARENEGLMELLDTRGREKATLSMEEARARLGVD